MWRRMFSSRRPRSDVVRALQMSKSPHESTSAKTYNYRHSLDVHAMADGVSTGVGLVIPMASWGFRRKHGKEGCKAAAAAAGE